MGSVESHAQNVEENERNMCENGQQTYRCRKDLSEEDMQCFVDGYRRLTRRSITANWGQATSSTRGNGMSKKIFRTKVFSAFPKMPSNLADRIFEVLNIENTGSLQLDELMYGLQLAFEQGAKVQTAQDTKNEIGKRLAFLFAVYDMHGNGLLAKDVLERFIDVVYGRKSVLSPFIVERMNILFDPDNLNQVQ